nr:pseudaminic acid synthase [uncultured Bdellovibrio sp.]
MNQEIKIAHRSVGPGFKPFIIAEMSGNHNKSLDRALAIVDAAAEAGADALKLQTYTADTMTLDIEENEFFISDDKSLWKGNSLHKLYQMAYTPWDWHAPIFERCKKRGMICFSTPFDETAVDFLETLQVPLYKIASFENTCIPLLKKVAKTGKPVIMSTGMATVGELDESVKALREAGCKELILLKCTSTYPATPEKTNILTIPHMRQLFDVQVGLSDHTMGCGVSLASIALGATVIEKHFTLNRADGGVDSTFSMEPAEFKILTIEAERAWQSLGRINYGVSSAQEEKSKIFRRSIYVAKDVRKGDILTVENIRCIRPGLGLETKYYELVLGKTASCDLKKGTPLKMIHVKDEQ